MRQVANVFRLSRTTSASVQICKDKMAFGQNININLLSILSADMMGSSKPVIYTTGFEFLPYYLGWMAWLSLV